MASDYAALAELAGGFIHEIKNHLGTLGLNLQLLAEDFQDPQNQRERRAFARTQKLQGECQRLLELSNDFLRFARIKELPLEPCELGKVVEDMIDFFGPSARVANIDIKCYLPADLPAVLLHKDTFQQALLNLLLNAVQAMPDGGLVTIQGITENCDENRFVCLGIIDTGNGMSPDVAARIFEPFFSTKAGGTGLGLATTNRILEAHGGAIDVESEVGRGTKFTLKLRIADV